MKCQECGGYRTRLHTCATCGRKLCGCCAYPVKLTGKRVCQDTLGPDPGECLAAHLASATDLRKTPTPSKRET